MQALLGGGAFCWLRLFVLQAYAVVLGYIKALTTIPNTHAHTHTNAPNVHSQSLPFAYAQLVERTKSNTSTSSSTPMSPADAAALMHSQGTYTLTNAPFTHSQSAQKAAVMPVLARQ